MNEWERQTLNLIKHLYPTTNLQKRQRMEEHVKLLQGKIQAMKNSTGQTIQREMEGEPRDYKRLKRHLNQSQCKTLINILTHTTVKKKLKSRGTSLEAEWLRIRLPMQGTWVWSLVQEDPTCRGATKPVHHNYWACALEPASHNYWSWRA